MEPFRPVLLVCAAVLMGCIEPTPGWDDPGAAGGTATAAGSSEDGSGAGQHTSSSTAPGSASGMGGDSGATPSPTSEDGGSGSTSATGTTTTSATMTAPDTTTATTPETGSTAPGQQRVFVSSGTYNGILGGTVGADAKCQSHADTAGLGGTWKALLSDSTVDARDRVLITGPVVDIMGNPIAMDATDLWDGSLSGPIALDEVGQPATATSWTGSLSDGTADPFTCADWTTDDAQTKGIRGEPTVNDSNWMFNGFRFCDVPQSLYCIGQ